MCEIDRIIDRYFEDDENRKKEVCERMGMHYGTFCRKTNPNDPNDLTFNIRELIPYTLNTNTELLDHIERRCGRIAIPIPDGKTRIDHHAVAKLAKEAGEAISACAKNIDKNNTDEKIKRECRKEVMDLVQFANTLLMALN